MHVRFAHAQMLALVVLKSVHPEECAAVCMHHVRVALEFHTDIFQLNLALSPIKHEPIRIVLFDLSF